MIICTQLPRQVTEGTALRVIFLIVHGVLRLKMVYKCEKCTELYDPKVLTMSNLFALTSEPAKRPAPLKNSGIASQAVILDTSKGTAAYQTVRLGH